MAAKNAAQLTIGTCEVWIDSNFVGYTGDQVSFRLERSVVRFEAGLPQIPVAATVVREKAMVTFTFAQITAQNLAYAAGADDTTNPDELTVPGSTIVQGGGLASLGNTALLELKHTFPDARRMLISLWKARPDPTFEMAFNSGAYLGVTSTWTAEEDAARAAGKRLWRIDIEDETKS